MICSIMLPAHAYLDPGAGTMMLQLQEPVEAPEKDADEARFEMKVKSADEAKK